MEGRLFRFGSGIAVREKISGTMNPVLPRARCSLARMTKAGLDLIMFSGMQQDLRSFYASVYELTSFNVQQKLEQICTKWYN